MTDKPTKAANGTVKLSAAAPNVEITPAATATAPAPRVVGGNVDMPAGESIKKAAFIDRVIARGDLKKRDAKPAIEAALAELADLLAAGEELVLPPMGKIKAVKVKELTEGAQMLTLKLRTMKDGAGLGAGSATDAQNAKSGVAKAGDAS
ncbi:HU family DNA-binding protein [Loktanella salsilacus]|uniref:HU family DNA-binding protein n=1 Tax=Loktanella salsilacus TaxID=195913 RepID=UPI003734F977